MNVYGLFICVLIFISCQSGDENVTENFPANTQQDSTIAEGIKSEDSIRQAVEAIGDYTLIATEEFKKCNLIKGFYSLNNFPADSANLALLAKYLAFELFKEKRPEANCEYPIMSQVFIYTDSTTYKNYDGDYLALCTTTPKNLTGEVLVNTHKLKGHKSDKGK